MAFTAWLINKGFQPSDALLVAGAALGMATAVPGGQRVVLRALRAIGQKPCS
jgi:hypothetical protein